MYNFDDFFGLSEAEMTANNFFFTFWESIQLSFLLFYIFSKKKSKLPGYSCDFFGKIMGTSEICRLSFQKYFALMIVFVDFFPKNITRFWS